MRGIHLFALLAALALALAACEGDADRDLAYEDVPPAFDLTGRWRPADDAERCHDQRGNTISAPPTEGVITQSGHGLELLVTRSGHVHYGRIAGEHFLFQSSFSLPGGSCEYEFSGTVFSSDDFTGVETIDCSDGSSVTCPDSHMVRIN